MKKISFHAFDPGSGGVRVHGVRRQARFVRQHDGRSSRFLLGAWSRRSRR